MSIGTWNNEACAIDITLDDTASGQLTVMMIFSASGQKQLRIFRVDETTGMPEDQPLMVRDNRDVEELMFRDTLPPGTYRICPGFSTEEWNGSAPPATEVRPRELDGYDPQGNTGLHLFAWDFHLPGANGATPVEHSAITLILVDNKVGATEGKQPASPGN